MTNFGLTHYLFFEKDDDGIWEVGFDSKRPVPFGSDGGIGEFRRERKAAEAERKRQQETEDREGSTS